jgi:glycosyltransferase involved in cell wall biosynthesis
LASVFVLPSLSEGSPNVLLEAMAANVPIVATSVGGIPDTIEDGVSGLLTPPRNPAALSSSIARILSEPALGAQLAAEAHRQVSSRFSPEIYRDRLLAVYERQLSA